MKSWADLSLGKSEGYRDVYRTLSLYNTASQSVEELPIKDLYRLYVCGITPYDATHLGHAATYVTFDLINRYLRFGGAQVSFVQNITDIDDPLFERAKRDGLDWSQLATSQIELFRGDMVALHVIPPVHYVGVVEAMQIIIDAVSALESKDSTYKVDDDLYFRVRLDPDFLKRTHLSQEVAMEYFAERGGDPQRSGKSDPFDALVWKAKRDEEPGWPSPFGVGRPGWHIECSAIALHYLHPNASDEFAIDIQGGGSDLIFPHHDMSAAQGWVATGQKFARFFVHAGMIGLDGTKMSKSLGNLIFVSKLINDGIEPMAIRLALLGHHYRSDHMWGSSEIADASAFLKRIRLNLARMEVAPTDDLIADLLSALANDLDTVRALSLISSWCAETENGATGGSAGQLSRVLDDLLGLAI
jgi:L-cysteine:1D-myo-inositol 2-amino-2-deoxy-alpha-D-glucopyranoside ligase